MQAVIARAEATAKKVNAFTYTHFDEALAAVDAAQASIPEDQKAAKITFAD